MGVVIAARAVAVARAATRAAAAARAAAVAVALALSGCTHLGTVQGAIPLEPGATDIAGGVTIARAPNAYSTPTGVPLPIPGLHVRRGLGPDLDGGLHVYPLGIGADLRYRFLERGGWHFAVAPGVSGMAVPIPGLQYAHLDVSLPVRAERALGPTWSIAGGPGVLARQTFVGLQAEALSTAASTFELYAGGGLRLQRTGRRLKLGLSADVYVDTTRATGLYGGVGVDFGSIPRIRARRRVDEIEAPSPEETE